MSFAGIRDQDVPLRLLKNILRMGRIPHGLLFWGPGGVGKRLTAIEFTKALNCKSGTYDACDECLSCRKIQNANHPDVSFIVPVKKSRIIDVDAIQSLNEMASLRPFESKWRVFIIQEADRMGGPAQNHFLKTLEEPPGNSLFILVTEYPGVLLPTIRSRCQRVRFGSLRPETVSELLRKQRDIPEDVALSIAGIAQGQMSRALDLVDTEKRTLVLDIVQKLADGCDPLALSEEFAKHLDMRRAEVKTFLKAEDDDNGSSSDSGKAAEVSREDREEQKLQQLALAEAIIRRDIMDYLYLFETWYRDQAVFNATRNTDQILNRDQVARLKQGKCPDFDKVLAAIEKARVYLERFLNEERVFRDLFFAMAAQTARGAASGTARA